MEKNELKILLLSTCYGEKKFNPVNRALPKDLDNFQTRCLKEKELVDYQVPAREMFVGWQNLRIQEGLKQISLADNKRIDLAFISSAYGFLNADELIVPYEVNFAAMSKADLDERAGFLKINAETSNRIKNYDLVFFFLSYEYLRVLQLPLQVSDQIKLVFLVSYSDEKMIPIQKNVFTISLGAEEANQLKVKLSELKGYIWQLICLRQQKEPSTLKKIYADPSLIREIIRQETHNSIKDKKYSQLDLFDSAEQLNMFD